MFKHKAKDIKQITIKHKIKQILILIALIICTLTLVSTFGRYVVNTINNFFLRSKEFYFYSDKLTDTSAYYQINNWTGADPYTITINMNSRLNNLKATSYDIDYNISYKCSTNCTCQLSKTTGIIVATTNTDYFNLVLTPNIGLKTGDTVWVQITAETNSKYKKKLDATFKLVVGQEDLYYEIVDTAENKYFDLNLTNTLSYYKVRQAFDNYHIDDRLDVDTYLALSDDNKAKCSSAIITISFDPNTVLLDMTNSNYLNATNVTKTSISGSNYISGMTFEMEPISSTIVRFYKKNASEDYTYPIVNSTSIINVTTN